jgi:hypothetical protein
MARGARLAGSLAFGVTAQARQNDHLVDEAALEKGCLAKAAFYALRELRSSRLPRALAGAVGLARGWLAVSFLVRRAGL